MARAGAVNSATTSNLTELSTSGFEAIKSKVRRLYDCYPVINQ